MVVQVSSRAVSCRCTEPTQNIQEKKATVQLAPACHRQSPASFDITIPSFDTSTKRQRVGLKHDEKTTRWRFVLVLRVGIPFLNGIIFFA